MNDKRELNDILIGGDDIRTKDNKKMIALILGIVILVLAIVIIVFAMTNTKSNNTTAENTTATTDANPQQGDFANMNVDSNNDEDRFEQIVRDMKNNADNTNSTISSNNVNDTNTIQPSNTQSMPTIRQDSPKITMPSKPARSTTPSKTIVSSSINKDTLKNGAMAESGYYLQVGAFSKTPNKDFIRKLNKFSYRKQEIMINSNVITRYLVGPYPSREAAQRDFDRVNRDIARPVFLQIQ